MCFLTNQGNKNKYHYEIFSLLKLEKIKCLILLSVGEDTEKREPLHSGNINWCSHCRKQYEDSSKTLNIELQYDPAIRLLDIHS